MPAWFTPLICGVALGLVLAPVMAWLWLDALLDWFFGK